MIQNGHFGAISGSGGSELVEQCGKRVEQVRAHWGDALEPFLGSGGLKMAIDPVWPDKWPNGWKKGGVLWNKSTLTKTKQKTSLVVMENQLTH